MAECSCEIPEGAVILNELHIVEFLDVDGEIWKADFSTAGGGEGLPIGKVLELAEWAKAIAVAPIVADLVRDYMQSDEEEE